MRTGRGLCLNSRPSTSVARHARTSVRTAAITMAANPHGSRLVARPVDDVEQTGLACGSSAPPASCRRSLEAVHVALQLGPGESTAAPDVHRAEGAGLHGRVDRRAADPHEL